MDSTKKIIDELLQGNRISLSRAITLVESTNQKHRDQAREILDACLPHSGKAVRIGITGVPGVGKSTFIEAFGEYLIKNHQRKIAVLAIDPSSQSSKGSILGDKTRMNLLSRNENAFIRPSPSSGALGGVAYATRETIILCEAAGFDTVLVETVGVGQSETEVSSMVDFFLLLMLAGAGDELQGIKRGIMELADLVLIHKADGDNLNPAKKARQHYGKALHLFPAKDSGWVPTLEICSSTAGIGHAEAWQHIERFVEETKSNGYHFVNRKEQALNWMHSLIKAMLHDSFYRNAKVIESMKMLEEKVKNGQISPTFAATQLIELSRQN